MAVLSKKKFRVKFILDPNMPDHRNDPDVLEKLERARASIKKYGLPKDLNKKKP